MLVVCISGVMTFRPLNQLDNQFCKHNSSGTDVFVPNAYFFDPVSINVDKHIFIRSVLNGIPYLHPFLYGYRLACKFIIANKNGVSYFVRY
jgi:hypothetical protein